MSNQSKISNSKLNKFSKNYILKNQDNENLTTEQQNIYGVLEDPNLPAISKKNTIKESEVFEQNIPLNNEQYKPNSIQIKSPTKYKFKPSESKKSLPQESPVIPNILTNNPPKKLTKSNQKIKYSTIVNPQKQTLPKQTEIKKFKFKIGQTSIKNNNIEPSNTKNNNIEPSESKIKNLKNEIQIESTNKNDIIVDLNDQEENYSEKLLPALENQEDTIVLIEKKPNNSSNKKYKSTYSESLIDQSAKSDLTNSENKKVFKFKKNLNSESKNAKIYNFNQNDNYSTSVSSIEKEAKNIKKFKLKKSANDLEKYKVLDEQNEQNI